MDVSSFCTNIPQEEGIAKDAQHTKLIMTIAALEFLSVTFIFLLHTVSL